MSNRKLVKVEVHTCNGADIYYNDVAVEVVKGLDYTSLNQAEWTVPIDVFPFETVEYNFNHVLKVVKFYQDEKKVKRDNEYTNKYLEEFEKEPMGIIHD